MRGWAALLAWPLLVACSDGGRGGGTPISAVVAEGRTLRVTYTIAADPRCGTAGGVAVEETATSVRLTARAVSGGGSCPGLGRDWTDTVTLAEPLGGRTVVDAYTGEAVRVTT